MKIITVSFIVSLNLYFTLVLKKKFTCGVYAAAVENYVHNLLQLFFKIIIIISLSPFMNRVVIFLSGWILRYITPIVELDVVFMEV